MPPVLVNSDYPASWYAATLGAITKRQPLYGSITADVVVVGAGLAGLTTALECVRRGLSVVLLDSNRVGWGASGRNGGMVIPGFAQELPSLVERLGLERALQLYRLSCEGLHYVREYVEALCPDALMGEGYLSVSRFPAADAFREEAALLNAEPGLNLSHWPTEKVRSVLLTDRYHDALFDPLSFHVHPLRYAHALADEFERLGGQLFENSRVETLNPQKGATTLTTDSGKISTSHVVLCTSAYDQSLYPALSRSVLPVATYVAVTEQLPPPQSALINTAACVIDTRRAGDYYRLLEDNRLLWGGKITTRQSVPRQLDAKMRKTMAATYASLTDIGIDYAWSGLMGYAVHKMPIIGQIAPGVWSATAFGGHGLNTTAMAGSLIAKGIASVDETYKLFEPFGVRWAGGPLGRAAVQSTYVSMQILDKLTELRADMSSRQGAGS